MYLEEFFINQNLDVGTYVFDAILDDGSELEISVLVCYLAPLKCIDFEIADKSTYDKVDLDSKRMMYWSKVAEDNMYDANWLHTAWREYKDSSNG